MNICLFSIKLPILVKICPTVIEILVLKVYRFQKRAFLRSMELTDASIDAMSHWQNKANKMVFGTENLVLINVLRHEVATIDE